MAVPSQANLLAMSVNNCTAWNMPPKSAPYILARYENQHGVLYVFDDNSKAWIYRGDPTVHVR